MSQPIAKWHWANFWVARHRIEASRQRWQRARYANSQELFHAKLCFATVHGLHPEYYVRTKDSFVLCLQTSFSQKSIAYPIPSTVKSKSFCLCFRKLHIGSNPRFSVGGLLLFSQEFLTRLQRNTFVLGLLGNDGQLVVNFPVVDVFLEK